jgi:hypothetical protein
LARKSRFDDEGMLAHVRELLGDGGGSGGDPDADTAMQP